MKCEEIRSQFSSQFEAECLIHCEALYKLARYLTLDENEAEDLFQDTLLRGFQFFHKFQSQTNCKAWLYKIMKNLFINQYHKKKSRLEVVPMELYNDVNNDHLDHDEKQFNPELTVLNDMFNAEIIYALNTLPADYKLAVMLADLQYLSYQEISEILNCPIGTVRSRISRGRKLLKRILFNYALREGIIKESFGKKPITPN